LAKINAELDKNPNLKVTVKSKFKTLSVTKSDGTVVKVTQIEKEISVNLDEVKGESIRIIQVIPKEVASSASKISGKFTILEDDPVIAFDVPVSSIVDGKATLVYSVAGDVTKSSIENIVTSVQDNYQLKAEVLPVVEKPVEKVVETTTPTTQETQTSNPMLKWILIIFVILLLIVGGYYLFKLNSSKK